MSDELLRSGCHVVTVLRGPALANAAVGSSAAVLRSPGAAPRAPSPATPDSQETVYGVPVSAIKHCCGRGCKHCRIYWHRGKP